MKGYLVLFLLILATYCSAQKFTKYIEADTPFVSYVGYVAGKHVYFFLQFLSDSSIQGHYHYFENGENIALSGNHTSGKISLFEWNKNGIKTAGIIGRITEDSISGVWRNLKSNKKNDVRVRKLDTTGDVYETNVNHNTIVFCSDDHSYTIPVNQYLNNNYNYTFVILLSELIDHKFYTIIRFFNYPNLQKAKSTYPWSGTEHFLLFTKSDEDGKIDTAQVVRIKSSTDGIYNIINSGSIIHLFKDSMNMDVINVKEKCKTNVIIGRSNISKGMVMTDESIYIPNYIFDNIEINLDDCYDIVIRYKYEMDIYHRYLYKTDSIYELNNRNIDKLSNFCKDLTQANDQNDFFLIDLGRETDITIDDYDFDGVNDICLYNPFSSGNSNVVHTIWTFDKYKNKYKKNSFLSGLCNIGIDKKNRIIYSGSSGGRAELLFRYIPKNYR